MNTSLLGVVAVVLAAGLWWAGRRPRPLLKSTDTRAVAALNQAQNSLVRQVRRAPHTPEEPEEADPLDSAARGGAEDGWAPVRPLAPGPATRMSAAERLAWLRELRRHDAAGGRRRLAAMRRARALGGREVLPLLRRGMRDTDPAVMREAALAMEAYRGRPIQPAVPRKVARTR